MGLLQIHQAKALRGLHEDGHGPQVLQDLRAATDLMLRAVKVTARSVGREMSTLVVQKRHLWLCLADTINSPMSQPGLFGDTVENSAVQKQFEVISHILSLHLSLLVAEGDSLRLPLLLRHSSSLHPSGAVEPVISGVPSPSRPPPRGAAKPRARDPRTGKPEIIGTAHQEMGTAPILPPEGGRVVNPLFPFSFCSLKHQTLPNREQSKMVQTMVSR